MNLPLLSTRTFVTSSRFCCNKGNNSLSSPTDSQYAHNRSVLSASLRITGSESCGRVSSFQFRYALWRTRFTCHAYMFAKRTWKFVCTSHPRRLCHADCRRPATPFTAAARQESPSAATTPLRVFNGNVDRASIMVLTAVRLRGAHANHWKSDRGCRRKRKGWPCALAATFQKWLRRRNNLSVCLCNAVPHAMASLISGGRGGGACGEAIGCTRARSGFVRDDTIIKQAGGTTTTPGGYDTQLQHHFFRVSLPLQTRCMQYGQFDGQAPAAA